MQFKIIFFISYIGLCILIQKTNAQGLRIIGGDVGCNTTQGTVTDGMGTKELYRIAVTSTGNVWFAENGCDKLAMYNHNSGKQSIVITGLGDINSIATDGDDVYVLTESRKLYQIYNKVAFLLISDIPTGATQLKVANNTVYCLRNGQVEYLGGGTIWTVPGGLNCFDVKGSNIVGGGPNGLYARTSSGYSLLDDTQRKTLKNATQISYDEFSGLVVAIEGGLLYTYDSDQREYFLKGSGYNYTSLSTNNGVVYGAYAGNSVYITDEFPDGPPVDDRPVVVSQIPKIVDESNLGPIIVAGRFLFDPGADGLGDVRADGSWIASGSLPDVGLSSNDVSFTITNTDDGYYGVAGTDSIFKLIINRNTGEYEFTLFSVLDHADINNPNDTITICFGVSVYDSDGDRANGFVCISIIDDGSDKIDCINIVLKVILGGVYNFDGDSMNTMLKRINLLPSKCPYDTTIALNQLPSNMTDWLRVDLVDTLTGDTIYSTQCACLLKNGTIQNISGDTSLLFPQITRPYISIRIKHRNHLSARSLALANAPGVPISFDFRNGTNLYIDPTITGPGFHNVGLPEVLMGSRYALWPGDANGDGQVKYQGSGNDRGLILSAVGGTDITNTVSGYLPTDINLNGQVKYQGGGNDRGIVLSSIGGSVITKVTKAHD